MEDKGKKAYLTLGFGSILGILYGLDPEAFMRHLSDTAANQVAQYGSFFTLAAWIHAGQVKREIRSQFEIVTIAINNVADVLRQDLDKLNSRVEALEKPKGVE